METYTQKQNKIINTWNAGNDIVAHYEDSGKRRRTVRIPFNWYFAIEEKDAPKAKEILTQFDCKYKKSPHFPGYVKIYLQNDWNSGRKKFDAVTLLEDEGIPTYEGDLMSDRKWYIDKEIEISNNYTKLYYDIETDDTIGKIQIGRDRIVSIAAVDDKGKEYFFKLEEFTDKAEKELLVKFLDLIGKYDILLGWNISGFDRPYIKIRMKRHGLYENKKYQYTWKKVAHFDLLKRFRHIFRFDSTIKSFSLDNISKHFLEKKGGKVERDEKIIDLYKNNQAKLEEYNLEDCRLVQKLDNKLRVSEMMIRQSSWCGVPVSQFGIYCYIRCFIY